MDCLEEISFYVAIQSPPTKSRNSTRCGEDRTDFKLPFPALTLSMRKCTIRVHKRRRPRHRRTRDRGYALREMEFLSDPYFLRMFRMDRATFDRLAEQ
ncbi:hypothetical protein B484DRAFT_401635, partial [Ochromonadaceae sp. CCMP2298]